MIAILNKFQDWLDITRKIDFLGPLALRIYLFPVLFVPGMRKLNNIEDVAAWFDLSLGLPFPELMAYAAGISEAVGAVCLLAGFAVRWFCIPLMVTMIVAAVTVHWDYGWLAIAGTDNEYFATERTELAVQELKELNNMLQNRLPGWYESVNNMEKVGKLVMLNNGIEFAATYFVMLLVLFFTGAGKYFSVDYWIARFFRNEKMNNNN